MIFTHFIARRYLFAKKSHNVINIISAISAVGLAVGAAALIIIVSVYNGFNGLVKSMLSSVEPDFAIVPVEGKFFVPDDTMMVHICQCPHLTYCGKVLQDNVFVSYDDCQTTVLAKGVDSAYFAASPLGAYVKSGNFPLKNSRCAMLGAGVAGALRVNLNFLTRLELYYPLREGRVSIANPMSALSSVELRPDCIFSVSNDIDNTLVIIDREVMSDLLQTNDEVSSIEIRCRDGLSQIEISQLKRQLVDIAGDKLKVMDRAEQNPAIYKMLRYEKAAVFFIMLLVVIVLGFSIFGSMSMLIIDKKDDIFTLRAMGATEKKVRRIFTLEGTMITVLGMVCGLAIGIVFCLLQQRYGFIKLPGNYLVESYPVILDWKDVLTAFLSIGALGYLIARLASVSVFSKRNQ